MDISLYIVADMARETGRGHEFGIIDEAANRGGIIGTTAGFVATMTMANIGLSWSSIWPILFAGYTIPAFLGFMRGWQGVQESKPPFVDSSLLQATFQTIVHSHAYRPDNRSLFSHGLAASDDFPPGQAQR